MSGSVTDQQDLLSAAELATRFGCSKKHIQRLADSGRMPAALRLGAALRWRRKTIDAWLDAGCPRVKR